MVEASAMVSVDFSSGPVLLTQEQDLSPFFDVLVEEVRKRNPALG
jgi:hypothetical protein